MKIIDYLNNKEKDVEIEELGKAGTGYNSPTIVMVNGVKGYKKKSVHNTSFDSFEYLISVLGKMLGIKVADTYLFDDGSIFSKAVNGDDEELLMLDDLASYVEITEEEIKEKKGRNNKLDSLDIPGQNKKYFVDSEDEIDYVVNIFIRIIKKLNLDNEEEIIRDYIRMCFLDCLTGNKDRVSGNYGLLKSKDNFSFAPLFDNSTIAYPNIPDNYIQLNGYLIDRDKLFNYITQNYSQYLIDIFGLDLEKIQNKLRELSKKVLNEKDKTWFDSMVTDKIPTDLKTVDLLVESSQIKKDISSKKK